MLFVNKVYNYVKYRNHVVLWLRYSDKWVVTIQPFHRLLTKKKHLYNVSFAINTILILCVNKGDKYTMHTDCSPISVVHMYPCKSVIKLRTTILF